MSSKICPICGDTDNDKFCANCGWGLSDFPLAFDIPFAFQARLKDAIDSGKRGWSQARTESDNSKQNQKRLEEVISQQAAKLEQVQGAYESIEFRFKESDENLVQALAEVKKLRDLCPVGKTNVTLGIRSALTYGIETCMAFDEGVDPEGKRVSGHGIQGCSKRFKPIVVKGQQVSPGVIAQFSIAPGNTNKTIVRFYATDKSDARYVDEVGVYEIGLLDIAIPNGFKPSELIDIQVDFDGAIELRVTAKHDRFTYSPTGWLLFQGVLA